MVSMRERVKQVFGSLEIHSRPGKETRIDVTIPLLSKKSSKSFSDEF
jgi:signal transduction histidine kinase